uniref:G_PROTEIN_RECEP_F1_2 domain-containing protein n=1 Tax=Angiostrongylus cantonensis TaxID=6313 RepID=A0A0K0DDR0_ANGCA
MIRYDVIGLAETRRRHPFNAVYDTGEELFLGTCDSRGVGGVGVLVNTIWRWEPIARGFGISYVILGSLAISLNLFFLYSLLAKRRKSFFHTFYIMILDFTIIDTIKGISSILFAIKLLKTDLNSDQSIISIRVDQYSGLLLRKRVVLVIVCIWIISSVATFAKMIVGLQNRNIWIDDECDKDANWMSSCVHRLQTSSSSQFIYHLGLVVFCLLCLAVTAYSYSILFSVVSHMVKAEIKQTAELEYLKTQSDEGDRRFENRHVLKRHKYVVVIGTVIGIYSVYLTAYATIQVLMLVNISE